MALHALNSGLLALAVNSSDLTMTIRVGGEPWLVGSAFTLHHLSPSDGTLVGAAPAVEFTGKDALGAFHGLNASWRQNATGPVIWETAIRAYDASGRIVFRQSFPTGGLHADAQGGDHQLRSSLFGTGVLSAFPALARAPSGPQLGLVNYAGSSAGNMVSYGSFPENTTSNGETSGCVVIVPLPKVGAGALEPVAHTLVFSQLDHFFASVVAKTTVNGTVAAGAGLMAGFTTVPAGFASEAVIVLASTSDAPLPASMAGMPAGGINHAVQKWGDTLLQFHGVRSRAAVVGPNASVRARYFGYSTTAFYHHNPCDPSNGNLDVRTYKSWEATLVDVHEDLRARRVPHKWMLIDSYWYGENRYGGTWLWEDGDWLTTSDLPAWPQRFEHGLAWLYNRTGLSFAVHTGTWVANTPYANASDRRSIGQWAYVDDPKHPGQKKLAFPQGPDLYEHLFTQNAKWNLELIKQDHITDNPQVPEDPDAWTKWFGGMDEAALKHGVRMMYCMAPATVLLNSVTLAASEVTRASGDYIVGHHNNPPGGGQGTNGQWQIGPDSMFHWGLGLLPYKDTFMSNTSEHSEHSQSSLQPAGKYYAGGFNGQEGNPILHALMAVLSGSYVTCSDGVGSANTTLLSRLYRTDGVLLKPSRPVTAIDAQLLQSIFGGDSSKGTGVAGPQGQLYATHTTIGGKLSWWYVAGMTMAQPWILSPEHLGLGNTTASSTTTDIEVEVSKWLTYQYDFGPVANASFTQRLDNKQQPHQQEPSTLKVFSSAQPLTFSVSFSLACLCPS